MEEVKAVQLRLFPGAKPLVERLGNEFFKKAPSKPGVYLMSGENDRLLYVGKAGNLRQRLNSYKNAQPDRAPRKVIRLVHEVRTITWEVCDSPAAALLRENQLLRLHKPKFNVVNTRPEHYRFLGLVARGPALRLRLTREAAGAERERLFGSFKGLGRLRAACAALFRLIWIADHRPESVYDLPLALLRIGPDDSFTVTLDESAAAAWLGPLQNFLDGSDNTFPALLEAKLSGGLDPGGSVAVLVREDLEALRVFSRFGPERNRGLRQRCGLDSPLIGQNELDDLLVLARESAGPKARESGAK